MERNQSYLLDVYQAATEAQQFVQGIEQSEFMNDRKTQLAVLYSIAVLGEAVKRLTPEFREQHSQIAWKQMAGMRDKLIHDYRQVNIALVWQVLQADLPELTAYIEPLLPRPDSP